MNDKHPSQQLAAFAATLRFDDIPDAVVRRAEADHRATGWAWSKEGLLRVDGRARPERWTHFCRVRPRINRKP